MKSVLIIMVTVLGMLSACDEAGPGKPVALKTVYVGTKILATDGAVSSNVPIDQPLAVAFTAAINPATVENGLVLRDGDSSVEVLYTFFDNNRTVTLTPVETLKSNTVYTLEINDQLRGSGDKAVKSSVVQFKTLIGTLTLISLQFDGVEKIATDLIESVDRNVALQLTFSAPVNTGTLASAVRVSDGSTNLPLEIQVSDNNTVVTVSPVQTFKHLSRYRLLITSELKGANQETFTSTSRYFYTEVDPLPQFPVVSDDELLTLVQQQTFKYFYDFAHPASGMARERNTSGDVVTTGGSGFGIMSLIVGMERGFITRQQGLDQSEKIVSFLETADRFHGAWPHWLNGNTGDVIPFSTKDNGGDLVETSFLVQGLLTLRQYLNPTVPAEQTLIDRINVLWHGVEWDWYRRDGQNVLYWHWSPNYNWDMNFALYGYFEEQITYFLAAASPTHSIPKVVYTNGFAKNGSIVKNNTYYGIKLPLESPGPLFWVHYSYLGLDPHFSDDYANYWEQNVNATLINRAYCIANPKNFVGYGEDCWGLTASDNQSGYDAHSPANDLGVISPTAALSSFPYTPDESMTALKFFYYTLGDRLWGPYGFYDAINIHAGWTANSYLAIDQGPIIVMIENHRTGLLWDLFMSAPEVQDAMTKLNFTTN